MNNQRGFAIIYFISFLPLLLAVGFSMYLFISFSDTTVETTHTCLRAQIHIQENVKKALRGLLKLNPKAVLLRAHYRAAQVRLATAVASNNVPAAAAARYQMHLIFQQRELLDFQQKSLITLTNGQIALAQLGLRNQLSQIAERRHEAFKSFMTNDIRDLKYKTTTLAVEAADLDLAPTYSLSRNFMNDQALEFRWQLQLISQKALIQFLPYRSRFSQGCSTTINSKEDTWPTLTREVRSPWKLPSS